MRDPGADSARGERVGQTIQPIIGGATSGTEHDAVVVLTNFVGGVRKNLCSATLVAPNLIITARHCVSDTQSSAACTEDGTALTGAAVMGDRSPGNLVVFLGRNGVAPNTEDASKADAIGAKIVVGEASSVCNADLAFLVLDKKLDAPYAPIRLQPPAMADRVAAVGWGVNETGALPTHRAVRADLALLGVGPGVYPENPQYGYGTSEFMVGESACAGDSGGPTFTAAGAVVGIASRAGNGLARDPYNYATTCMGSGAHAVYTHLAAHQALVTRAFAEAGEPMWLEGEPDPRLPKPQATSGASTPAEENAADQETHSTPLPATPGGAEPASSNAGGCSMSSEPQKGAVEYAAGLVALFATLMGLRRRLRRTEMTPDGRDGTHRERMPSMP